MIPSTLDPKPLLWPQTKQEDVISETPNVVSDYTENSLGKAQEIEKIRKALHHSQGKLLWEVLDKGRQASHVRVRKNSFLQKLTTGGFCQTAFMKYLVNLMQIHTALEEAQECLIKIDHLKQFVHPELFRSEAIKRDLGIWESVSAPEYVPWKPSEKTLQFAEYIRETAKEDPERIIAIMYTLYGTIMSGGQTNKKIVQKALEGFREYMDDIPSGSGVALYEIRRDRLFSDEEIATFKMRWHEALCRVEKDRPSGTSIEDFHAKLVGEVTKTFETILEIIENNVEQGHC